ncbi:protein translation initiation factor IF-2a [Enterocytozoon bieneusi H348]|nr:protein translation initiation factor IF-2a [Enterocytozoon bieneusi H348]|eukprot:XP_002650355.1 protein translation initiation factor IF-2a [Enterocytozoon bieneusi H348]
MFECTITTEKLVEGQFVIVKIIKIEDNIITAKLLEYTNIEGLIMPNEISRRRIRNITQVTKLGRIEVCQVLKIENEHVDLSLKQVDEDDKSSALERYKKNKLAYSIAEKIAKKLNKTTCDIYQIYDEEIQKYGSLYNFFGAIKENIHYINKNNIIEQVTEDIIYQEFKASVFKIRADIDITCPKSNGIEIIKKSLDKGIEFDKNIEICLLNTPTFSISKTCNNKEIGFQCINNVLTIIKNEIENSGGEFHLMVAPKIYGEKNKHNMLQYKMDNSENDPNTESSSD